MKAAIYVRLSEEDRDKKRRGNDSESIQNQKKLLLQYALEQGFEVVGIYSDDDYKGSDRSRPAWNRLLNDAAGRKFTVILSKTQARFTREIEASEKYLHGLFPQWGIRFIGVADNADTANKGNKKARQINGLVNEWYLEDMSDSIKAVFDAKRKEGLHIGSFALYGYKKDPESKGRLLVDDEAAAIVREIFRLFADGMGKDAIARRLNARGVPNPTEYKRLTGIKYKTPTRTLGTVWKYFAISNLLANEMYIGHMIQGRYGSVSYKTGVNKPRPKAEWYRVEDTHPPIVDRELWNRVQERLRLKARPFGNGALGLFAGKVFCTHCGYAMRTQVNRSVRYLKCGQKHTAKEACVGSFIRVSVLEQAVVAELNALLDKYLDEDAVARKITIDHDGDGRMAALVRGLSEGRQKINTLTAAIRGLYLDKAKGIISESDFITFSRDFSQERKRHEAFIQNTEKEIHALECKHSTTQSRHDIVAKYRRVNKLERIIVEKLIDRINIGKRVKGMECAPVDIYWKL
jgi:DNA invertase Pin-like site-specific DNA recombinase